MGERRDIMSSNMKVSTPKAGVTTSCRDTAPKFQESVFIKADTNNRRIIGAVLKGNR